jgi:hypothetical protein
MNNNIKNFPRDQIWCWSLTIAHSDETVVEPRVFFDWDGKFIFRKDDNRKPACDFFKQEEFLPFKTKIRAQR